jgi:hypothetical protein
MSQIEIQDIDFYFDAQAKNRFDYGYLGRKNGQILQLRELLLNLPEDRFESTFKSIETLVMMQNKPHEKPNPPSVPNNAQLKNYMREPLRR